MSQRKSAIIGRDNGGDIHLHLDDGDIIMAIPDELPYWDCVLQVHEAAAMIRALRWLVKASKEAGSGADA